VPVAFPFFLAERSRALALAAVAALSLTACGRIGPLEPPPDASAEAKAPMPKADQVSAETLNPQMKPKIPPITPPNQPFFLDFLLK
jgi:predicted small lipoprotein YifL